MKDLDVGDKVLNSDGIFNEVYSIRSALKEAVSIKTKSGIVNMSKEHRMWVYDTEELKLSFETGEKISQLPNRYKMLKSKINSETKFLLVTDLKLNEKLSWDISTDEVNIYATENDNFLVFDGIEISHKHVSELEVFKDYILFGLK